VSKRFVQHYLERMYTVVVDFYFSICLFWVFLSFTRRSYRLQWLILSNDLLGALVSYTSAFCPDLVYVFEFTLHIWFPFDWQYMLCGPLSQVTDDNEQYGFFGRVCSISQAQSITVDYMCLLTVWLTPRILTMYSMAMLPV